MIKRYINTLLILVSILVVLCSYQCDGFLMDRKYPLYISNNSDRKLLIDINTDGYFSDPEYPDTTISERILTIQTPFDENWGVKSGHRVMFRESSGPWEVVYETGVPSDTLSFIVYDIDTLNKYPPETIRNNYMILKRYDLSIYDLQKLDYTLYYPPSETMRNMKMFPPFGDSK